MGAYLGLFLLSAATLAFELVLTRLFSVSQFYHFAFLAVSLALLGFGASGTLLSLAPHWAREKVRSRLSWLAAGCGASILGSYLVINSIPFDSYAIAWDRRQLLYLALYLLSLAVPFGFSGLAVGLLLAAEPGRSNRAYAANLVGSAAGCLLLLPALPLLGGEGTVVLSAWLALLAAAVWAVSEFRQRAAQGTLTLLGLLLASVWLVRPPSWLALRISPYKGLYQALLDPAAVHASSRWNAFSRVDVVQSPSVRSLPGLSMGYRGPIPAQVGVAVDGDHLMPVTSVQDGTAWALALPEAIAYQLRPGGEALVLNPGGGLAAITALANGAGRVMVVESNPLLIRAVRDDYRRLTGGLYRDPRVALVSAGPRAYLRQTRQRYSVIHLPLTDGFRPVRSGAFSLGENYLYTVEAFADYLRCLNGDGLLVVTRWLQSPPSESVRLVALALEALARNGAADPAAHLVAFRSFQTGTLLVKASPWTAGELESVRAFCGRWRFDLSYYSAMIRDESNRYVVLQQPVYFDAYAALAAAADRRPLYRASEFDVAPPTDDRPFFFHFFKWRQAPQVLRELGSSWQPFGGAGYFVLLILLALAAAAAAVLILLPLAFRSRSGTYAAGRSGHRPPVIAISLYFGLLGLGFLLVEIPLIQQFILFLDQPTLSLVFTLFAVLLFSGLGSLTARRWRPGWALGLTTFAAALLPPLLNWLLRNALGWTLPARLALTLAGLAPLCFLMGLPFARGLAWLESMPGGGSLIPWAWAINGSSSVVAGVLAALLSLSLGFRAVLWLGAAAYAGAWLVVSVRLTRPLTRG